MNTKNYRNKVTFIIPTLTNTQGLLKTLGLLSKFNENDDVVIVNNNKKLKLEDKIPISEIKNKIVVLNQYKNTGFAKACNDGAKKAKELFNPNYLVFLNDDVSFRSNFTNNCLDEIHEKKWISATPVLMRTNNEVENCGYKVLPIGKIKLITSLQSNEKIDGLSATALVFSTAAFFRLKGFDERFFAYLEDVDLFLRAKKAGMKFGVCKKVKVYHKGQATSSKMSVKKAFLDFKNWILIISKHWSREELTKNLLEIIMERGRNLIGIAKAALR
ncbi:MAG: glycosyltransferase [Patescibacteria group bacterium]